MVKRKSTARPVSSSATAATRTAAAPPGPTTPTALKAPLRKPRRHLSKGDVALAAMRGMYVRVPGIASPVLAEMVEDEGDDDWRGQYPSVLELMITREQATSLSLCKAESGDLKRLRHAGYELELEETAPAAAAEAFRKSGFALARPGDWMYDFDNDHTGRIIRMLESCWVYLSEDPAEAGTVRAIEWDAVRLDRVRPDPTQVTPDAVVDLGGLVMPRSATAEVREPAVGADGVKAEPRAVSPPVARDPARPGAGERGDGYIYAGAAAKPLRIAQELGRLASEIRGMEDQYATTTDLGVVAAGLSDPISAMLDLVNREFGL